MKSNNVSQYSLSELDKVQCVIRNIALSIGLTVHGFNDDTTYQYPLSIDAFTLYAITNTMICEGKNKRQLIHEEVTRLTPECDFWWRVMRNLDRIDKHKKVTTGSSRNWVTEHGFECRLIRENKECENVLNRQLNKEEQLSCRMLWELRRYEIRLMGIKHYWMRNIGMGGPEVCRYLGTDKPY